MTLPHLYHLITCFLNLLVSYIWFLICVSLEITLHNVHVLLLVISLEKIVKISVLKVREFLTMFCQISKSSVLFMIPWGPSKEEHPSCLFSSGCKWQGSALVSPACRRWKLFRGSGWSWNAHMWIGESRRTWWLSLCERHTWRRLSIAPLQNVW